MSVSTYALSGCKTTPDATKRAFHADPTDPRHGTRNGYGNLGCRCGDCTDAISHPEGLPPGDPRHGTLSSYVTFRCRCPLCRAANTAWGQRYRARQRAAAS